MLAERKNEYSRAMGLLSTADDREARYRNWDNLKYWFRGVEQFAPWVRKIYFVAWGHTPTWLNIDHPKLQVVCHRDFIPSKYLPTFNSHTIEWNLHRIEGLPEQFVYFNDDVFLLNSVRKNTFFVDDKPRDMLALHPDMDYIDDEVMPYVYLNNTIVLAKYFNKHENMRRQPEAYFHIGYPIKNLLYKLVEGFFYVSRDFTLFMALHL